MTSPLATQVAQLSRRSFLRSVRQPGAIIPALVFPLMLLFVNSGGLRAEVHLPGFPTRSFLDFALAVPFMQGALFATTGAGVDLARDIETGFLKRLSLTPMSGVALVLGQLAGALGIGVLQACFYLAVGLVAGAGIASGVGGALVLLALAAMISLAFASIGVFMALRTGSGEAVQGLFPLIFVLFFISSMNIPRNLIEADWFRWAATLNPVSYLIEGVRSLIITGWDANALGLGFGVAATLATISLAGSSSALRGRLQRT